MSELNVFFDKNHLDSEKLSDYLNKIGLKAQSIWFEIKSYSSIKDDLHESSSLDEFVTKYFEHMDPRDRAMPNFYTLLSFVVDNRLDLWAIGEKEEEIELNVKSLVANNDFKGLHLLVIGSGHSEFFKQELEPILEEGFERVTYYSDV